MKILFVSTHTNPFSTPINGDAQRTRLLLQACAQLGEVDVVTFAGNATPDIENVRVLHDTPIHSTLCHIGKVQKWLNTLFADDLQVFFPVDQERGKIIDRFVQDGSYDCIVSRYIYRTLSCGLWKYRQRLVVDFDDTLPFYFRSLLGANASVSARLRNSILSRRAGRLTKRAVKELKAAFFAEKSAAIANHATLLPNIPYYRDTCDDSDFSVPFRRLLFVGQLDYKPNRDGVSHFLEHVYAPLCKLMPSVEIHIVGLLADQRIAAQWQSYSGVTLTGYVNDLMDEYRDCHVVVAPIYQCGGTNIKLLEAVAMNRACVTTMEAFEKLHGRFENGKDLFAASNDDEFVEMLVRLLTDEMENHRIAHNAKATMNDYYSFESFCQIVKNAIVR